MLRTSVRVAASSTILALLPLLVQSASPSVTAITPRGGQRGQAVEIVVAGKDLTDQTRLALPFPAKVERLPEAKPNPAQARFSLTVDPAVPAGIYPIHVVTEEGVSPLQWFVVDHLPQVSEAEPNQPLDKAQAVPFGVTVTGQSAGGDVDYFRFPLKKGQRVVLETESARLGSGLLPQLRLTDAAGKFLAADDSQKLRGDARLIYRAAADGDYIVEISDSRYRGGNPPHYRLRIADGDAIEEVFPLGGRRGDTVEFTLFGPTLAQPVKLRRRLDAVASAGTMLLPLDGLKCLSPEVAVGELPEIVVSGGEPEVKPPVVVNGRLAEKSVSQRVRLAVQPGQKLRLMVEAESLGSYLDGVLRVTDQAGKQLALVDDVNVALGVPGQAQSPAADPQVELTVPAGVTGLVVEVRDQRGRGGVNFGYRLTIEPLLADFALRQPVSELNVPRGGTQEMLVPVIRRGYTGSLQLTIPNLPPGLAVQGGQVPADGTAGVLTISSQAEVADPVRLWIDGVAMIDGKETRRRAELRLALSNDMPAASIRTLTGFTLGLAAREPFAVQGPPMLEAVAGYPVNVAVMVTRDPQAKIGPVEVSAAVPPYLPLGGKAPANSPFALQPGQAAAESATVILTPRANAPVGTMALLVQGKTKINNKDATVVGPAIPLTVKPPFTVEAPAGLEVTAGGTAILKGKLASQPVFKEAVQWKVEGLPKGLALVKPPTALTGGEFQVELKADPKLTPAKASLTLIFTATIAGAAYNHPPVTVPIEAK